MVMVGTPKAIQIFERDLRSSRRAVGLGSIHWEPMKNKALQSLHQMEKSEKCEWMTFTDSLWKYSMVKKIRPCIV